MDNTLTPDQARIVYQNALLREPENEQVIQGRHFDEMMGGVKIELSQRFSEIQNKPAIIQTIYVDKPVEVPVDITTDEEKKTWMEEYAKNNPPIVMVRDMSPIEAIKVLWNAIINYLTKTKE